MRVEKDMTRPDLHALAEQRSPAIHGFTETDTPNFSIDTANRPIPLHTEFHAIVDGTNGDTFLDPVKARLRNSFFTARGVVRKVGPTGHDIDLNVDMPNARIEDMLDLAVQTRPALMHGSSTPRTSFAVPLSPSRGS